MLLAHILKLMLMFIFILILMLIIIPILLPIRILFLILMLILSYTYAHRHTDIHSYVRAFMHSYIHTDGHSCIHAIQTDIQTHRDTNIQTCKLPDGQTTSQPESVCVCACAFFWIRWPFWIHLWLNVFNHQMFGSALEGRTWGSGSVEKCELKATGWRQPNPSAIETRIRHNRSRTSWAGWWFQITFIFNIFQPYQKDFDDCPILHGVAHPPRGSGWGAARGPTAERLLTRAYRRPARESRIAGGWTQFVWWNLTVERTLHESSRIQVCPNHPNHPNHPKSKYCNTWFQNFAFSGS